MFRAYEPEQDRLVAVKLFRLDLPPDRVHRLVAELEEQARALGHETVRLYTNRSLTEAKAMYRARGYVEIPRYNHDPYANHWFEKRLTP